MWRILILGVLAAAVAGCGASGATGTNAGRIDNSPALNVGDVTPAQWRPLPPATVTPEVQAARDRLLGPGATDPGQVRIWWYGVSSFIVSAGGHLFLFDAWEIVGVHENYAPIGRDDLVALKPEVMFFGHGHFDHAADAGYIASRTGAAVIGGSNVCLMARQKAAADGLAFPCLLLGNKNDRAAGSLLSVKVWQDLPALTILKHIHSAADPADLAAGGTPLLYVPEVVTYLTHLNTDPTEIANFLLSLQDDGGVGEPTGGTWAYHLRVGDFSLLWHDSSGPISGDDDAAAAVRQGLDSLPGCVDVELGSIIGFGMVTSGLQDPLTYVASAHPRLFLPGHHDAWMPGIGGGAAAYEAEWTQALAGLDNAPAQDYLRDPDDYLKVRSFGVNDPQWKVPMAGSSCVGKP